MALRFSIPWFLAPQPMPSLGGGRRRYRPVITMRVVGPRAQETIQVIVDSAADDIVVATRVAHHVGVDLSSAVIRTSQGVGYSQPTPLYFAPVILELNDGKESCRWRAVVGFTPVPPRFAMFGVAGGLEYYRATFDIADRELLLDPKPSLPRTDDLMP